MSTHPPVTGETYREKALRKFKQQPIVPVGAPSLTVACRTITNPAAYKQERLPRQSRS
jgi:hypothetical protein